MPKKLRPLSPNCTKRKTRSPWSCFFDDINLLAQKREIAEVTEQLEDDSADLDEMLDDSYEDTFEDKDDFKKIDSPIKAVDDDFSDADDGN